MFERIELMNMARAMTDHAARRQIVVARNVANADTDGYKSEQARLSTGADGYGVQVSDIARDDSPGALRPESMSSQSDAGLTSRAQPVETSNVDLAQQAVSMIETQRAFEANTAVIRTEDQMAGTLLDMRV